MSRVATGAVVESERLGERVSIGEFAIVRAGAEIGDEAVIHPHAIIGPGVSVGPGVEVLPGAVLGKEPALTGAIAKQSDDVPRTVRIGPGCSIGVHAVLYDDVSIGADTLVGDAASIREGSRIGARCIIGRNVILQYNVAVGDGSRILGNAVIVGNSSVGRGVFVGPLVGSANDDAFGRGGYADDSIRGPTIEDGAMIGIAATLMPGVAIGREAVVGAGAVVTKDVEPETRVMGVPARPVGTGSPG